MSVVITSQALAIAKPPPSRRIMFQGTESWAFFHDNRGTYGVFEAGGGENISVTCQQSLQLQSNV